MSAGRHGKACGAFVYSSLVLFVYMLQLQEAYSTPVCTCLSAGFSCYRCPFTRALGSHYGSRLESSASQHMLMLGRSRFPRMHDNLLIIVLDYCLMWRTSTPPAPCSIMGRNGISIFPLTQYQKRKGRGNTWFGSFFFKKKRWFGRP